MKVLLVGQGVAGSVLALTLMDAGLEVHLWDEQDGSSASALAAGVVNPVTGKRYALSWQFDLFQPFAKTFYQGIEQKIGATIWYDFPLLRLLGSPLESNEWHLRSARPEFAGWMQTSDTALDWSDCVAEGYTYGLLEKAGRADFSVLLSWVRAQLQAQGRYYTGTFDYGSDTGSFDAVIFCEGAKAVRNPYFTDIPWQNAKGDRLLIRIPDQKMRTSMLKKQVVIVPYTLDTYWAGANFYWAFEDHRPNPEGRQWIESELRGMLRRPFEVVDHAAGIRPVVKDRRPMLGWSRVHSRYGIFNGLGSKGALLAPYWAQQWLAHLTTGAAFDPAVDVRRFSTF